MIVRKAFKFRLKPSRSQVGYLHEISRGVVYVWNWALEDTKKRLDTNEEYEGYSALCRKLTVLKHSSKGRFLEKIPSVCLQQKVRDFDRAVWDAFKHRCRFPKFKSARYPESFRFLESIKFCEDHVYLRKVGWCKFQKSRDIVGVVKNASVSCFCDRWYVSFGVRIDNFVPKPRKDREEKVDVYLGDGYFSVTKRHEEVPSVVKVRYLRFFEDLERELVFQQRRLSRKVKGSKKWEEQKRRVQKIHGKIWSRRCDFLHKYSHLLTDGYKQIFLGGLKVKELLDENDSDVNKVVLDQGWFEFSRQLKYKALWRGGEVVEMKEKG